MADGEDPFASFITKSIYSSSQEEIFRNPFEDGGILICSAPEEDEDFQTPPEGSLLSTYEEPEPELEISSRDWKTVTNEVESDGEVRIGEKRSRSPQPVPSPSKKIRVLEELASTPELGIDEAGDDNCLMEEPFPSPLNCLMEELFPSPSGRVRVLEKLGSTPGLGMDEAGEDNCLLEEPSPAPSPSGSVRVLEKLANKPGLGMDEAGDDNCLMEERFPTPSPPVSVRVSEKLASTPGLGMDKAGEDNCLMEEPFPAPSPSGRVIVLEKLASMPGLEMDKAGEDNCPMEELLPAPSPTERVMVSANTPELGKRGEGDEERRSPIQEQLPSPSQLKYTSELETIRAGEKRSLIEEPLSSPAKVIGVSAKRVSTPKLGKTTVETEECNAGDTVLIEECDDEEESFGTEVEVSKGKADDLSRKGKRELPSWAYPKEDARGEEGSGLNKEKELKLVMEMMALLSKEAGPSRCMEDVFRVAKGRGWTFPEPKWWHDVDDGVELDRS